MTARDHYAEFLAAECKDIENATWLTVERAFEAGRAVGKQEAMARLEPAITVDEDFHGRWRTFPRVVGETLYRLKDQK